MYNLNQFFYIQMPNILLTYNIQRKQKRELINDTIERDEERGILSNIITPQLDSKQTHKFLEGLAKIININQKKKVYLKGI
ncbi:unnamed protein product [Paramecium sonneborni]|uniref:Uncharacterized protein n=1 Tax=Paramecium sonneborni TaxID=65129 RepID=A0A8S1LHK5_9CILI|nr:unnamed protein product [Paramecium sonneborni]